MTDLQHPDNHVWTIAGELLSNLDKSDPERRNLKDFEALLAAIREARFMTARHTLQSLWKVGAAGEAQCKVFLQWMSMRFAECATEKNGTLIRYDILVGMKDLYIRVPDEPVRFLAEKLIERETDLKYRKKFASVWKKA